jgi:hypothetical protein
VDEDLNPVFLQLTGARSGREMARAIGIDASTLGRHLRSEPPVGTVVALCRAYGLNVIEVFVRVGYITETEAAEGALVSALQSATDEQLAQEMLRRVRAGSAGTAITEPVSPEQLAAADVSADADDDEASAEDFDVEPDLPALAKRDVRLAANRGTRKIDQPHAE